MEYSKSKRLRDYPKVITDFPEADIQIKGIKAWVSQGENHQIVFFEMEPFAVVPDHWHAYAQWGLMIDGEMELTIDGKTQTCRKGDEYVIPAQAKHYARFRSKSRVMDLFSEKTRYRTKSALVRLAMKQVVRKHLRLGAPDRRLNMTDPHIEKQSATLRAHKRCLPKTKTTRQTT